MIDFTKINELCNITKRWPKNYRTEINLAVGIKTVQFKAVAKPETNIIADDLNCTDANLLYDYLMKNSIKDCPNADAIHTVISEPFVATDTNTHGCRYTISYYFTTAKTK